MSQNCIEIVNIANVYHLLDRSHAILGHNSRDLKSIFYKKRHKDLVEAKICKKLLPVSVQKQ